MIKACHASGMLQVETATKTYQDTSEKITALDKVSLTIHQGEFVTIMGPSGCGKSTLMHCIGGLDQLDSGQIFLNQENITHLSDTKLTRLRREKIGFVFQFFNLLPTLTVEENVTLPLELNGSYTSQNKNHALSIIERVGLSNRLDHMMHQLSGGQMQRAALARALVHQPTLLLADEPTGNLDSHASEDVIKLFKELGHETKTTIIMVTHSREIAATADRIIYMKDGRIENR
ncbi:MAG: ABC transporter ATP-binding protein [Verrucomicrobiota bacterium]